jgi:hypothetical protein
MTGPKPNRKWGREQGRRICALPLSFGSREEEMIRSSVLRYRFRREEEIGTRLSNEDIYELYRSDRQSRN